MATTESELTKGQARAAADKRLREAHPAEHREYLVAEFRSRGMTYKPRLSEEEKAAETIDNLLRQFPDLAGKYVH